MTLTGAHPGTTRSLTLLTVHLKSVVSSVLNTLAYSAGILVIGVMFLAVLGMISITMTIGFAVSHWQELDRSVRVLLFISAALAGFVLFKLLSP